MLDTRICIFSDQDHLDFLLQEKGQSGGTESSERGSVPSRKTDPLHDLRPLSSHWCSWHSLAHEFPSTSTEAQSQIFASSQCSYHNTRKRQGLPGMGHLYWRVYSPCGWWNFCWMVCHRSISRWKNGCLVWSGHHRRGSSCFFQVPELTPTTPLKCRPWLRPSPLSRTPWPGCPWCEFVYLCYDSKHAAGVCLGTIQARTHVQLALACQQSMLNVQHRSRFTMQHVYGHTGNLGNECADHAAGLGVLGLVSNHNSSARWARHNFDTAACFGSCNNIRDVLGKIA